MNAELDNGMTSLKSPYSVDESTRRIEALLRARGLTIFGVVDHRTKPCALA